MVILHQQEVPCFVAPKCYEVMKLHINYHPPSGAITTEQKRCKTLRESMINEEEHKTILFTDAVFASFSSCSVILLTLTKVT